MSTTVFLGGPSLSGRTTLARELGRQSGRPWTENSAAHCYSFAVDSDDPLQVFRDRVANRLHIDSKYLRSSSWTAAQLQVYREAHAIVVVVDSQRARAARSKHYVESLQAVLEDVGRNVATIPTLLFLNKQDLLQSHSPSELEGILNWPGEPAYLSGSAKTGDGVKNLWRWLARVSGLQE